MADVLIASALTTLATVKEELGITGTASDNALIRLINAATDQIEQFCNRTFHRETTIAEKTSGYADHFLALLKPRINSIASITFDGSAISSADYEIHDAEAGIVRSKTGPWTWTASVVQEIEQTPFTGSEQKLFTVTYDGGWYTRKQNDDVPANTRTLPWDLEHAANLLVNHYFRGMGRDPSIKSESLMSWSASYGGSAGSSFAQGLPDDVASILLRYQRLGFA